MFQLMVELEVSGTVLLQAEEMVAVCKADLSSQKQAMQEIEVVRDNRKGEMDNVEEKVKVCTKELENIKLKSQQIIVDSKPL